MPKPSLRKDEPTYQDFKRLIEVRNHFVHLRPQIGAPKFFQTLVDQGWAYNTNTDKLRLVGWMNQLRTPQIAKWACRSAHNIINNIIERFDGITEPPIRHLHLLLNFQWAKTANDERVVE